MKHSETVGQIPDVSSLKKELQRTRHNKRYRTVLKSTVYVLIVVAAISVLVATLWMPVLRTNGYSMTPTLDDGDVVISVKSANFDRGDLIAFYVGNKLLIKRVIAAPGEWVVIDDDGYVYINDEKLYEDYVETPSLGNCNIEFPYQVPESCWFVLGDHRETSVDSRNTAVGCVYEEEIVGRVVFRVWPLGSFGTLKGAGSI
jgi:signal peptidase I